MKYNYFFKFFLLFLLVTSQAFAQVDVTFKVDMTGQTVSADGVHVVGSINGWSTTATTLTQEDTTNIYSATIELSPGWYEYKFLNGNDWGTPEEPKATYPCAPTNGNRFVAIGEASLGNVVLATVPFGGCNEAGTSLEITFNVDMSSEGDIAQGSVHLTGWLNGWSPDNLSLPNKSGNIHSGTLRLPTPSDYPVTLQYKYLSASGWGNDETPDANCASVTDNNRQVTFTNTNTSVGDVFNGCNYSLGFEDFNQIGLSSVYNKNTRSLSFISEGVINSIAKIQIFDMSGKRVHNLTKINNLNAAKIDLNGTPNGLYLVQAEINGSDYVKKVLVY